MYSGTPKDGHLSTAPAANQQLVENGTKYSRIDQVKFHFKFFKGYLPKIKLGPFLNTLPQIVRVV